MSNANSSEKFDFVVAGGGIGGLAASLALARKGFRVAALEKSSQFGEIGAGIQVGPNAYRALEYLGAEEAFGKEAVFIERLVIMDSVDGEQIINVDLDDSFRQRFGYPYSVIHRRDLHDALLNGCRSSGLVALITDAEVVGYDQSANGVEVMTAAGDRHSGGALIGADGLHSNVRKKIAGDKPPIVSGHVSFRAVIPVEEMPEDLRWNAATLWAGPNTHIVHYPLRGWKLFNLVATCNTGRTTEGSNEPADHDEVMSLFARVCDKPKNLMASRSDWRAYSLAYREPIENWCDGRATLLGDAAHPTLQYWAQGACMAIEDGVILGEEVARHGSDIATAFKSYQEKRLIRTARVQLESEAIGRHIYHNDGVHRLVRNEILRRKSEEDILDWFSWLYKGIQID